MPARLKVSVKAPQLYVCLLCSESTPPEVVGYAAAALGNLAADYYGASSIDAADRSRVLEKLDLIIAAGVYPLPVRSHALVASKNIRTIQSKVRRRRPTRAQRAHRRTRGARVWPRRLLERSLTRRELAQLGGGMRVD